MLLAQNLWEHHVFSFGFQYVWGLPDPVPTGNLVATAARAPLYPLMLAPFMSLAHGLLIVRVIQAVLGAITVAWVFVLAKRYFSHRVAVLAALMMTFGPMTVYSTILVLSEVLFMFLLTGSMLAWSHKRPIVAGLLLGLATLARAVTLPYSIVLAIIGIVWSKMRREYLQVALVSLLVVAPWTVRNYVTQHHFIPVNTLGWGSNLYFGTIYVPYNNTNMWLVYGSVKMEKDLYSNAKTDIEAEQIYRDEAIRRIKQNPVGWVIDRIMQYPRLFAVSPQWLTEKLFHRMSTLPEKVVYFAGAVLFYLLGFVGMWLSRSTWRDIWFMSLYALYIFAAQFPMMTEERYALITVPVMAIFAGHTLVRIADAVRARRQVAKVA